MNHYHTEKVNLRVYKSVHYRGWGDGKKQAPGIEGTGMEAGHLRGMVTGTTVTFQVRGFEDVLQGFHHINHLLQVKGERSCFSIYTLIELYLLLSFQMMQHL